MLNIRCKRWEALSKKKIINALKTAKANVTGEETASQER